MMPVVSDLAILSDELTFDAVPRSGLLKACAVKGLASYFCLAGVGNTVLPEFQGHVIYLSTEEFSA